MSTYLVTGAAGFIASKVCEMLLAEGHTVVGVDNLNDYYDVRLKDYRLTKLLGRSYELGGNAKVSVFTKNKEPLTHNRFEFRVLDIENLPALEEVFKAHKFEAVFNLAARAGVRASLEHPELYRRTNVLGEENVLKCQVKYKVRKHVLASSSSVYAGCPMPFTEDAPLGKMQSPYAETKRQAELLAKEYHEKHGLDVTVLRYFTVFGPAGRPDMAPFRFIKWIDEGTPITLYGDGTQARDFTYIDDIARGTILAGRLVGGQMTDDGGQSTVDGSPQTSGFRFQVSGLSAGLKPSYEVINLGGGNNPISLHTIIGWIEKALTDSRQSTVNSGSSDGLDRSPSTDHRQSGSPVRAKIAGHPASAADMKETWADIAKAKRLLDWSPQVRVEDGFKKSVEWHVQNREWLKGISV